MLETVATPTPAAQRPAREIHLTPNARLVLTKRYLRRGEDGKPVETVEQMFERISRAVAAPDAPYGTEDEAEAKFFDLLTSLRFFPNSPTFTGAGTPLGQLAACFTPAMRVTTDRGVKRIAELQIGDRVLTHQGRYRPVTELFQRAYEGELLHIKVKLIGTTLEVTPEHPILTPDGWVKAGDLKAGDRVAVGLPQGTRLAPHFDLAESVYADELELQAVEDAVRVRRPSAYQNSGDQAMWSTHCSVAKIVSTVTLSEAKGLACEGEMLRFAQHDNQKHGGNRASTRIYSEIEAISSESYSGIVYNCEVDEDHSYVTEGVAVHNCFVLPIDDDMGKDANGIFQTLRNAALIQQTGGGNGFSFSRLRPKNDFVATSAGTATGPVGFLRVYDKAFGEIAQGGSRRGANMGVLRVDHPDVMEFIRSKADEGQITNFNISVALTDKFMQAVKDDTDFDLINPRDGKVWKTMRARDIFDEIVKYAHRNGEPGCLFIDAANRTNPVPHLYALESTNPCLVGETRIATEAGLIRIADLAEQGNPLFLATDNRAPVEDTSAPTSLLGVALRPGSPAWMTRRQTPVYRVVTRGGFSVTATPDHRFLTTTGYVALKDLKPGHSLLLQSGEGAWSRNPALPNLEAMYEAMSQMALSGDRASGTLVQRRDFQHYYESLPTQWSHGLGLVMGWLVGDGWLSETSHSPLGMVFAKPELLELVHAPLQEWFGSGHVHERGELSQLTYGRVAYEFFRTLGVQPVRAHDKRLPEAIWTAPREAVVGFLQGLFSADGTVHLKGHNHDCSVRLASSSLGLLEDVQVLLSNFGIIGRIYLRRQSGVKLMPDQKGGYKEYAYKTQYELILGRQNRDRFARLIGFVDEAKQAVVESYLATKKRASAQEIFTDAVLRIEAGGVADVYDLSQPQTHSLIANGITLHNCGEQWLGPYENCCLGSINLAQHFLDRDGRRVVDWAKLQRSVEEATHFLDNVVTANKYVPAVPELREAALRARRIGLGIMGLGDLMYALGVRYGSRAGEDFAGQIMEFVRYHCMKTSVELAKQRGPFTAIQGSIYDPQNLKWQPPTPLQPYTHDWGRPAVDWDAIVQGIRAHGIRNAAQTTIAPTGTIATVAGCEGYGCEPVFALAYIRHVKDPNGGPDIDLTYASPLFEQALKEAGIDEAARQKVYDKALNTGTCQDIPEVPASVRDTFVVASDITPEEHVRMQAAMQSFTDNSLSKTCNFPEGATVDDVAKVYMLAWELGCKGLTVYVTGSREEVVLETKQTLEAKKSQNSPTLPVVVPQPRERQSVLSGRTYRMETPIGTAYVTVNDLDGEPYEVFINVGKGGSDIAAVSEALGRLCSLELQTPSPLGARERAKEIVHKLRGIAGSNSVGFGPNRVASLPDAIAVALNRHIGAEPEQAQQLSLTTEASLEPVASYVNGNGKSVHRDICPECGQASLVFEEGCRHCSSCGYSKC